MAKEVTKGETMEEGKKKRLILCAAIGAVVLVAAIVVLVIVLSGKDKVKATTMRLLRIVGEVTLEENGATKTIIDNLRLSDGNALSTASKSLASVGLDDTKIKISECKEKKDINIVEYLKDTNINVNNYNSTCKRLTSNTLILEIYALDNNNKTITYTIPIKLNDNCKQG